MSQAYIGSWIGLLRQDDRAIFTAASRASQVDCCLRSFSETVEDAP
jgi:antirestriction protein ArdC